MRMPRARPGGCLVKLLLIAILLLAFVMGGPMLLLSGLLQYL
jgi:hypothetical protein